MSPNQPGTDGQQGRSRLIIVLLALTVALAAPLGALVGAGPLADLLHGSTSQEAPGVSHAASPASEDQDAQTAPGGNLTLARQTLLDAAGARDLSVQPLPLPQPSAYDPLEHALRQWLFIVHGHEGQAHLDQALDQAEEVPEELEAPLAQLLLAHAQATMLQREALDGLTGQDRARLQTMASQPGALASQLDAPSPWLQEVADTVDMAKTLQASLLLLDATDQVLPELEAAQAQGQTGSDALQLPDQETPQASTVLGALSAMETGQEDRDGVEPLDDLLGYLVRGRVDPAPAVPLTTQLSEMTGADALGEVHGLLPAPGAALPAQLDREIGRLYASATLSTELLSTEGPASLATAHLLRARSMAQAQPTLAAWSTAIHTLDLDTRTTANPHLAAAGTLDQVAGLPGAQASTLEMVAFGLGADAKAHPTVTPAGAGELIPAFKTFYDATGHQASAGWQDQHADALSSLSEDQRRALATLLQATAQATDLAHRATQDLDPTTYDRLQAALPSVAAFTQGQPLAQDKLSEVTWALSALGSVDLDLLGQAALVSAAGTDTALALLDDGSGSGAGSSSPATTQAGHDQAECPEASPLADCEDGIWFADPAGLVVLGGPEASTHTHDRAPNLLLDLGGDDRYRGPVAAGGFDLNVVSLAVDTGGEDVFDAPEDSQGWGQAGIGLLVQAGGDTTYRLGQQGQGAGVAGIGALIDHGGDDSYRGGQIVQGAGLSGVPGLGLLADRQGQDTYNAREGVGRTTGGTLVDLGGTDTYKVSQDPLGIPLDEPVDADDVADALFDTRRDNALWLDGAHVWDYGFGIDVDTSELDHDGDTFPSLVEALASSDANNKSQTPRSQAQDNAGAAGDDDEDGSANLAEEAAGTSPRNGSQSAYSLPETLPLVPSELADLYTELRAEHSEAPPPDGLILDVRLPFDQRTQLSCALPQGDTVPITIIIGGVAEIGGDTTPCPTSQGPGQDRVHETQLTSQSGDQETLRNEATLGLVAVGDLSNSTYELPYLLSLDLGGNDTYEEGAGGAVLVDTEHETRQESIEGQREQTAFLPLTHLDLSGNDTYLGGDLAHGAGGGLLVDLGGFDAYHGGLFTQGALGGILLDAGTADDRYNASHASQGTGVPAVNFTGLVSSQDLTGSDEGDSQPQRQFTHVLRALHGTVSARTLQPSLLLDAGGHDTYTAGKVSQGYAAVANTLTGERSPIGSPSRSLATNGTWLLGGLIDRSGDDTYTAGAYAQAVVGPGGLALLADRDGQDTYTAGGLVSQAAPDVRSFTASDGSPDDRVKLPGAALLLDPGGLDTYLAHASHGTTVDRSAERNDNLTRERVPLGEVHTGEELTGDTGDTRALGGQSLGVIEAVHADLEGSLADRDDDGWPDSVEAVAGTDAGSPKEAPAATDEEVDGFLIRLPSIGLAVGDDGPTSYDQDMILAVDLGGDNVYTNNAGGPLLDPLTTQGVASSNRMAPQDLTLDQYPVTAVIDAGHANSTFQTERDLSQAASLFTVGMVVTSGGQSTFQAPTTERTILEIPEGPTPRIDANISDGEWPLERPMTWASTQQPGLERPGILTAGHDGARLHMATRIPDPTPNERGELDRFHVYVTDNATDGQVFDRLTITPEDGGQVIDQHLKDASRGQTTWAEDRQEDPNRTRARMSYTDGNWTLELTRPNSEARLAVPFEMSDDVVGKELHLELCQPTDVVNERPFQQVDRLDLHGERLVLSDPIGKTFDADDVGGAVTIELRGEEPTLSYTRWWWEWGDNQREGDLSTPDTCKLFETEDVWSLPGHTTAAFIEYHDAGTGETWRLPATGTATDGALGYPGDGNLTQEVRGWQPIHPQADTGQPDPLFEGPEVTQGAAVGGVSILVSLSATDGRDTYEAHQRSQGYGALGGIGLLADLHGSDTYEGRAWSQGAATDDGTGVLLDLYGNDRYQAIETSQGYATDNPQGTTPSILEDTRPVAEAWETGVSAWLIDLSGFDHYAYDDEDAKRVDLADRTDPNGDGEGRYRSFPGNDQVWSQGVGGAGIDHLADRYRWDEEVPQVAASASLDLLKVHPEPDGDCKERVPDPREPRHTVDPFPREPGTGALVVNGTVCLEITVRVADGSQLAPYRVELLREGEQVTVTTTPTSIEDDRLYRYGLRVDTQGDPDGYEEWRAVAYVGPEEARDDQPLVAGVQPVVDQVDVKISQAPSIERFQVDQEAFSPHPAIGEPGLPIHVEVTKDVSEDPLVRQGYTKDRANVPCPADTDQLCNRYPLFLGGNGDGTCWLSPNRPDSRSPSPIGRTTTQPGAQANASGFRCLHDLPQAVTLLGGQAGGLVHAEDVDKGRDLLDDVLPYGELDVRVLDGARSAVYLDDGDGAITAYTEEGGDVDTYGDLRLTPLVDETDDTEPRTLRPAGTLVRPTDPEITDEATTSAWPGAGCTETELAEPALVTVDLAGDTAVYLDNGRVEDDGHRFIDAGTGACPGDIRLAHPTLAAGTIVAPDDPDDEAGHPLQVVVDHQDAWRLTDEPGTENQDHIPTGPVYIDRDASGTVTRDDVRLGHAPASSKGSARLVVHHAGLWSGNTTLQAQLGTVAKASQGQAPAILNTTQATPLIAEGFGQHEASPASPWLGPDAGQEPGWSTAWLGFDETRTYPDGPRHGLELQVRHVLQESDGALEGTTNDPDWDGRPWSVLDCSTAEADRGLCLGASFGGHDLTPSRLELYLPTRTEQAVVLNATDEAGRNHTVTPWYLEGGVLHEARWNGSEVDDGEQEILRDGTYNLSLVARDALQNGTVEEDRYGDRVHGPEVLVDGSPPTATLDLPRFVGTSQIDPITETFRVPWSATDGDGAGVEEVRIYAASGTNAGPGGFDLVDVVRGDTEGVVDVPVRSGEDDVRVVAVAMDRVGNIEGVEEDNHWPAGSCAENPSKTPWPPDTGTPPTPDLAEHCFLTEAGARKAAFQAGIAQIGSASTTLDRSLPVITSTELSLDDGLGLPEHRIQGRDVQVMAAGQDVHLEACVDKDGPSRLARVSFFMVTSLENGTTIQRTTQLNQTGGGCYSFDDLGAWTDRSNLYPEGFWTAGFEATDEAGNIAEVPLGTLFLDTDAPASGPGAVMFPRGQEAVTHGQELRVDATFTDANEVAKATLAAPALNQTGTVELSISSTDQVQGSLLVDRQVPDGEYTAYLNITDGVGNTRAINVPVPVDTTEVEIVDGPRLADPDPALTTDTLPAARQPAGFNLTFTTDEPSRYRILAGTNPSRMAVVDEHLGAFETEHLANVTGLNPSTTYFVQVEAFGPGGITAETETFRVVTGSTLDLEVTQPSPGSALAGQSSVSWTLTPRANTTVPDDAEASLVFQVKGPGDGAWETVGGTTASLGNATAAVDLTGVRNGRGYDLRLQATVAEQAAATLVRNLTVDKELPTVTVLDPEGGWANTTRPTFTVAVDDVLSGTGPEPVLDARIGATPASHTVDEEGHVEVRPDEPVAPGTHQLILHVQDAAGNQDQILTPVHVDTTPPDLHVASWGELLAVRPGHDLSLEITGHDDGRLALAEASLGTAMIRQANPPAHTVLDLPAPDELSKTLPATVRLVDAAGNQATLTKQVRLDATPPSLLSDTVQAGMTTADVQLTLSEPATTQAVVGDRLFTSDPGEQTALHLTGLTPGQITSLPINLTDQAGNTAQETIQVETKPDLEPPTAPGQVTAKALPNGTLAVSWSPATDNAGIQAYKVLRATDTGQAPQVVATVQDHRFIDTSVTPGTTYTYQVHAVDVAQRPGPANASDPVKAVGQPTLRDLTLTPDKGGPGDTFTFQVTFAHPGGPPPETVTLVLDGDRIPMTPVDQTEAGQIYQAQLPIGPHDPSSPHLYHVEAGIGEPMPQVVKLPSTGAFEGPLVTVLDQDDGSGTLGQLQETPLGLPVTILAVIIALTLAGLGPTRSQGRGGDPR